MGDGKYKKNVPDLADWKRVFLLTTGDSIYGANRAALYDLLTVCACMHAVIDWVI